MNTTLFIRAFANSAALLLTLCATGEAAAQNTCGNGQIQILSEKHSAAAWVETRSNGSKIRQCSDTNFFNADLHNTCLSPEFADFICKVNASYSQTSSQFVYNATAELLIPEEVLPLGITRRAVAGHSTSLRIKAVGGDVQVGGEVLHEGEETQIGFSISSFLDEPGSRSQPISKVVSFRSVSANADTFNWAKPEGGAYETPENWNPTCGGAAQRGWPAQ